MASRLTLKGFFTRGAKPTAGQFASWIDSFWHKDEDTIPVEKIAGLSTVLAEKASVSDVDNEASTRSAVDNDLQNQIGELLANGAGQPGPQGPAGPGIPAGGSDGQVLSKSGSTDFSTQWTDPATGVVKASTEELNAGTNDTKFATPAGLASSAYLDQSGSKNYVVAGGTDTYTGAVAPAISNYVTGSTFNVRFTNANTGHATLNLNSLGALPIKKNVSTALAANDITAGACISLMYDGALDAFQIIGTFPQTIPPVSSGEKIVTVQSDGVHTDYALIDQIPPAGALTSANWSSGSATANGTPGQFTYDSNYRYDCIGVNTWKRSPFLGGAILDEYLAGIDDTTGDKTSAELNTTYSVAVIGQKVWGTNNLYIKKTATVWQKIPATIA
ncbi:hypothetical protein ACFFGT_09890 [Mucilaginibacter angelicae]|uniref:Tail fiber protein n=1 Tax=Mucilaginibacter angelicae TaxID=869718 RepID=A0ABV6L4Y3_9SPHI